MNGKKRPTEYAENVDAREQGTYQTGSTRPPKSHGGVVAFLLGLVIFLCGISTSLGLMNIELTQQLNDQTDSDFCSVAFSRTADTETYAVAKCSPLGFTGQAVSQFWQLYNDLPQGVYITYVGNNTEAAAKGVSPGDILLSLDGIQITDMDALTAQLSTHQSGDTVIITIYRSGKHHQYSLTIGATDE